MEGELGEEDKSTTDCRRSEGVGEGNEAVSDSLSPGSFSEKSSSSSSEEDRSVDVWEDEAGRDVEGVEPGLALEEREDGGRAGVR